MTTSPTRTPLRCTRLGAAARLSLTLPPAWVGDATCRAADPELFFPISATGPAARQAAVAKRVCAVCPVAAHCLDWALAHDVPDGIWGGHTPAERAALRPARPARPRPVEHSEFDAIVHEFATQGMTSAAIADRLRADIDDVRKARGRVNQRVARHRRRLHREEAA